MAGHTLIREGAPFWRNEAGEFSCANLWGGTSGAGRGLCSCGACSEILASGAQRKFWHREHKLAAVDQGPE